MLVELVNDAAKVVVVSKLTNKKTKLDSALFIPTSISRREDTFECDNEIQTKVRLNVCMGLRAAGLSDRLGRQ